MESTSDQVNNECVETTVVETVPEPTTNSTTTTTTTTTTITNPNEIENDVKIISKELSNEPERTQQELAAMLRILIANFCDEHFVKKVKKAKLLMDNKSLEKINEQKNENVDNTENKEKDQIDEMDTVNLTLSPPSSSVSNYSQTKTNENETKIESENPSNQSQEPSKLISSLLVGLDKLEIFGSIHVRSNNVRLLSCLIDEQLTFNNSDVSFSSASSSISSSGRYKFHLHRHSHGHRRHRGRHGYKKFREIKKIQAKKSTNHHQEINSYPIKKFKVYHDYKENKKNEELNSVQQKSAEDGEEDDDHNKTDNNLENLASVAAQAVKLNTEKTNSRKPRKSPNVVPIHDDSELEYMNDDDMENGENFNEENVVNDALYAEEDNSSIISESFSDSSLLRHRRHRSNSSLYSEPSSIISSHKNNRLSRSPSLGASSSYGYENEYRSYSSCSSLSDYDAYDNYDSKKSHKRKDKNDRHKSDRKRMSKEQENMINSEDIKIEKEVEKEIEQPLQEPEVNPIEERRREEEYLMRKYKRRFSSFKNSDTQDQNLYLLESSRQHHRVYDVADMNQNPEQQVFMQKMMNVNSLVDRLSPISDPDMEHNLKNKTQNFNNQEQAVSGPSQKSEILNRINNLSPSSSSSSSSSIKNQNSLAAFHSLHNSQQNNAAAVLAAAAAAAAAAADLRNIHPHAHLNHNTQLHNHHAQSVAQLLADMQHQQQTHSQSEAAKVIAATLSNHHQHHPHLNPHHLLNRFSNNNQNDLMAAVLAQQQQQQQQQQHQHQQHRSLLDTHTHLNSHQSYSTNGQLNQNGPIYNRYSSHLNAAIAAASAAAANLNSHQRRANSVESDATPSPPSTTPAVNGMSNNTQSISSAASSTSSTSENYKYKEEPKVSKEKSDNGNGNEKVRLVAGYDVFISTNDLNACNDDRGSATRLLRNLMDVFFDKSTLAKSSINGTGRITNTLDKHVISALFAYVKNRYPDVPHSQLTRAATDKCVQTRRNFRKKIKAAQSYFGMFPSLMMTRPPQLPQASENPV